MKKTILFAITVGWLTLSLFAADSSLKSELTTAARQLGEKPNYSWRTTHVVPESSPFHPGPTEGKTEKGGFTFLTMSFNDSTTKAVIKGDKTVATDAEGNWQTLAEMDKSEGPGRFIALIVRNFKLPSVQSAEIASYAKDLKKEGDLYSSDMTEEGARKLLTWRTPPGAEAPTITSPNGSMKFWLKDGALTKYEFKLKGTISFNGNEFESERTSTVEIKDVGTTKVAAPEEAKKKLM
jgi:hypothetical protein